MLLNQIYASIDCFRFINQIDEKKKMERSWLFKTKQNKIVLEITYFVFWINPTVFLGWQNAKKWFIRYSRFNSVRKSIGCFFPLQQFDLALLDPVISFFLVPFIGLWNSAHFAFLTMNAKFAIFESPEISLSAPNGLWKCVSEQFIDEIKLVSIRLLCIVPKQIFIGQLNSFTWRSFYVELSLWRVLT